LLIYFDNMLVLLRNSLVLRT